MDDETMNITSAVFVTDPEPSERLEGENVIIKAVIDGKEMFVPMDLDNRHYKEILRQTEAKTLVIQEETP